MSVKSGFVVQKGQFFQFTTNSKPTKETYDQNGGEANKFP